MTQTNNNVHPPTKADPARRRRTTKSARTDSPSSLSTLTRQGVTRGGEMLLFALKGFREVPAAIRLYPEEVFRQAGLLVRSSVGVVLFIMFVFGFLLTLQMTTPFGNAGIDSYMGFAAAFVSRGLYEIVFAWTLAAKTGCGIVAELGAMRIDEEIDALEVMGIRPIAYLVSTRLVAGLVVIPFLWCSSLGAAYGASYLAAVPLTDVTSQGGFVYILFLFQNMFDFVVWMAWALIYGVVIILVACYFGYTATGGPFGVGRNTAWSMLVNIVLISLIAVAINQVFYGNNPNLPIGN